MLQDAGLLVAIDARDRDNRWDLSPKYLTWAGHEFLEATRNDNVWKKTLEFVENKGGAIMFEILKDVALMFLRGEYMVGPDR